MQKLLQTFISSFLRIIYQDIFRLKYEIERIAPSVNQYVFFEPLKYQLGPLILCVNEYVHCLKLDYSYSYSDWSQYTAKMGVFPFVLAWFFKFFVIITLIPNLWKSNWIKCQAKNMFMRYSLVKDGGALITGFRFYS